MLSSAKTSRRERERSMIMFLDELLLQQKSVGSLTMLGYTPLELTTAALSASRMLARANLSRRPS
eukprot:760385-Hanusia_phi.AAC.2